MTDIFVYGVLMFKDIREALLGKDYPTADATLHGYSRKAVKELPYPGLVESENDAVQGILLRDISIPDTTLLDKFEEDYDRILVEIEVDAQKRYASTYMPKAHVELTNDDWEPEEFAYVEFYLETVIPEFYANLSE